MVFVVNLFIRTIKNTLWWSVFTSIFTLSLYCFGSFVLFMK
ncbi:unnamed protein product [Nippostrongylus brasiliensis]|uniref:Branched-chain amino acid ABC transporter permease n=1 Tax=Nippostrongylus brasiliensis TaxID=27835 RepID=A0A0N4YGT8_NIPBR|nr:unnamed protein product [Nippostrongylus brasiliensis]